LAAAAHKARQKTKDNTIQIEPSTNSIVIMLIWPSIERARSNFAARASVSAPSSGRGDQVSRIATSASQDEAHARRRSLSSGLRFWQTLEKSLEPSEFGLQ